MCFRKKLGKRNLSEEEIEKMPTPQSAITNKRAFIISTVIFLCAVILLVTHGQTGLTVSTIGIIAAAATCITAGKKSKAILRRVDYPTLVFFTGLFVVVGGLEETGILELIATFIHTTSGGNITFIVIIIIWISAVASAIIDNIPFSATMIPIIKSLLQLPVQICPSLHGHLPLALTSVAAQLRLVLLRMSSALPLHPKRSSYFLEAVL